MKQTVSFDFDGTLTNPRVLTFARSLINREYNVVIVTSRFRDVSNYNNPSMISHDDLFKVAKSLGIKTIIFTDFTPKEHVISQLQPLFHIDNDQWEVDAINQYTDYEGVLFDDTYEWIEKCENILKNSLFTK